MFGKEEREGGLPGDIGERRARRQDPEHSDSGSRKSGDNVTRIHRRKADEKYMDSRRIYAGTN